ncbi:hypothetical protein SMU77_09352, partial [Streptococcus mutans NV1996]
LTSFLKTWLFVKNTAYSQISYKSTFLLSDILKIVTYIQIFEPKRYQKGIKN